MRTITDPTAPSGAPLPLHAPPGLKGLVVADTALGDVRGAEGYYHYRGHSAVELARTRPFEDLWYLLLEGHLPDAPESRRFVERVARARTLPAALLERVAAATADAGTVLDGLRTALSMVASSFCLEPLLDLTDAARAADAVELAAVVPVLVATVHRARTGQEPVASRSDLGHAADLLWMVTGEEPSAAAERALDRYLGLTADHGFNASTFTARVVASTGADLGACVVAALGALSGPLHGGAPSRALELLDLIGEPDRADAVVRELLGRGERIMGFGHAVYTGEDPRSVLLRETALEMGGPRAALAVAVEEAVTEALAELRPERELRTNVEFHAGVVMEACGIPPELFTPTFAVSRTVGWTAHALEQARERRIIRPSSRYVGPPPVPPGPSRL